MESEFSPAFESFQDAVRAVLQFLYDHTGFQLWMFTRVEGEDWSVLEAWDRGYGVKAGDVFRWSDSICSRMVRGLGPQVALRAGEVEAYREASIDRQWEIGAYIGIPISRADGSLFGTLCALDPSAQPDSLHREVPLIQLQARLLTTILHDHLKARESARKYERAKAEAQLDSLTEVYNRRGWERLLAAEESRCQKFGQAAGIIIVDLDNLKRINDNFGHAAGDRLIRKTADCLKQDIRDRDVVARLGGDEFAVLVVDAGGEIVERVARRLQEKMDAEQISASVGWAARSPDANLQLTMGIADRRMYAQKLARKQLDSQPANSIVNGPTFPSEMLSIAKNRHMIRRKRSMSCCLY
jgi:diguanylate cyclase (GGDEF)-like protein